jgi:hypothetical protein
LATTFIPNRIDAHLRAMAARQRGRHYRAVALSRPARPLALRRTLKLFAHPPLESHHVLRTAEEVLDEVVGGHCARVAHRGIAREQVLLVELLKEILGDHLCWLNSLCQKTAPLLYGRGSVSTVAAR